MPGVVGARRLRERIELTMGWPPLSETMQLRRELGWQEDEVRKLKRTIRRLRKELRELKAKSRKR